LDLQRGAHLNQQFGRASIVSGTVYTLTVRDEVGVISSSFCICWHHVYYSERDE